MRGQLTLTRAAALWRITPIQIKHTQARNVTKAIGWLSIFTSRFTFSVCVT
jgi:hypothetical protein